MHIPKSRIYLSKSAFIVLLSLLAGALTFAQTVNSSVTSGLEEPSRHVMLKDALSSGRSVRHWVRQYFISGLAEVTRSQPNVVLHDTSGNRVRETNVWFPDSVRVRIFDATVTPAGNIVASGYATRSDGSMAFFIAKTDLFGAVTQVVRTNPFKAEKVCALDEDTVWSFGMELDKEDAKQDYRMLRNYSFTNGLLHAYVPRRSLKNPPYGTLIGSSWEWLSCSGTKVAVYTAIGWEYIQLNVARNTLDRFPVDQQGLENVVVTGFALTDTGHLYASLNEHGDGALGLRGLFELKYNASSKLAQWVPIQPTLSHFGSWQAVQTGKFLKLWGTDGTNLIYEQTGQGGYAWAKPKIETLVTAASAK